MNTVSKCMRRILLAALLLGVSSATLAATAPATVGYQGRLYDQNGNPITATVSVVFALYAAATGGTAVWTETQSVTLTDGYFTVQLGSVTAFGSTAFDGTVRYLGVTVGSDSEMTPRTSIASVPYALNAVNAATATTATTANTALSAPPDARFGTNTSVAVAGTGATCTLGEVILTAGTVANGMPAQGQLLQISSYAPLFSLLGTTYGGDGVTTFALPDLRSAAPNGLTYSICMTGVFPTRS
jgi:microcystin-dependent protein